jgi:hypothetical protein
MSISKITGFEPKDTVVLNDILRQLDSRIGKIDGVTPTADADETKFSHKVAIQIAGTTYYIMLTTT